MRVIKRERRQLGARLRAARRARNLTQMQASEAAGVHHTTLVRIEAGLVDVRFSTLITLARTYLVPLYKLFKDDNDEKKTAPHAPSAAKAKKGSPVTNRAGQRRQFRRSVRSS